jgi:predicted MFS family arabinose efflux permease
MRRPRRGQLYYGWVVAGVTALTLLVSIGLRTAPAVLIAPVERDLGWDRAALAGAAALGLLLYGLAGPVTGQLIGRAGPRRVMLAGLALMGLSAALSAAMTAPWQVPLLWGLLSGLGTGLVAPVLGATVASRWFVAQRGLVLGLLGATSSAGQLIFVPLLMATAVGLGWRAGTLALAALALLCLAPVGRLMRDDPAELGLQPYGGPPPAREPATDPDSAAALGRAARTPAFWLLAGSFAICGATSNGLVSTHFIAHTTDHGIPPMTAAGALAVMGGMNFAGTVASGWLTDRCDPRWLLAVYYAGRGAALALLPLAADLPGLTVFAVIFGLDYYATVPPTQALTADLFGQRQVGLIFGWIFVAHQAGAAAGAILGGLAHSTLGDYQAAFLAAAALVVVGALMALAINRTPAAGLAVTGTAGR